MVYKSRCYSDSKRPDLAYCKPLGCAGALYYVIDYKKDRQPKWCRKNEHPRLMDGKPRNRSEAEGVTTNEFDKFRSNEASTFNIEPKCIGNVATYARKIPVLSGCGNDSQYQSPDSQDASVDPT